MSKQAPPPNRGFFGIGVGGSSTSNQSGSSNRDVMDLNALNRMYQRVSGSNNSKRKVGGENGKDVGQQQEDEEPEMPGSRESFLLLEASSKRSLQQKGQEDDLESSKRDMLLNEFYNATEKEATHHIDTQDHFAELDQIQKQQQSQSELPPLVGLGGGKQGSSKRRHDVSMIHSNEDVFAHVSEVVDYDNDGDPTTTDHGVNLLL